MDISVGYRVKSHEGVRFRRWATLVLRDYLLIGVAIDRQRLEQLGKVVQILSRSTDELASGMGCCIEIQASRSLTMGHSPRSHFSSRTLTRERKNCWCT
nr:RhuM family protein [Pseudoclavibacter sp. CFCC 14310]